MRHGWQDRQATYQRETELLLLGAVLASKTFAETVGKAVIGNDMANADLGVVFDELQAKGVERFTKEWLAKRGVKVNGTVVSSILDSVQRTGLQRRTRLAASAGDEELIRELMAKLEALERKP